MKVGIFGCNGRMGRSLITQVLETESCVLVGGTERSSSSAIGQDIATLVGHPPIGRLVEQEPRLLFDVADVVIDFSSPEATFANAALAAETHTALVVGTTGLESQHTTALAAAAQHAPVLYSPNMSLGMNVLFSLVKRVSHVLDDSYDIEVFEMHHRSKVDAPSGTALELGRAAALGRGRDLAAQRARDGHIGQRQKGHIGFAVARGGDVIGEHTVLFIADGERVEMTHKASARGIFVRGAMRAASWLWEHRQSGLYSMQDVLGLEGRE
ncbi:4-hydroxy-tetrahydrodipicolinate reductase [invertebrate metagenome]|uniref:4-hydroxy-tetrahydrodipicolinate reductase n=1 Tax=invertebrate metagenome TaxID=1711999 RepID=A0A484H6S5_9ZZZZ